MGKRSFFGVTGEEHFYHVDDVYEVIKCVAGRNPEIICETDSQVNASEIAVAMNHLFQYSDDVYTSRVKGER